MGAGTCFAAGLISYELLSYHLTQVKLATAVWASVLLAIATGCGVLARLVMSKAYDRFGTPVVISSVILSALFLPPASVTNTLAIALTAMPLLGIGYAVQDTLLKAIVVGVLLDKHRNFGFGMF